jgi:hypothetical protein
MATTGQSHSFERNHCKETRTWRMLLILDHRNILRKVDNLPFLLSSNARHSTRVVLRCPTGAHSRELGSPNDLLKDHPSQTNAVDNH